MALWLKNMLLSIFQLKNLLVYTQSGIKLGRIIDLEIDAESQSIIHYLVQRRLFAGRFQKPLLIHRSQVISVSREKMIVEDLVSQSAAFQTKVKTAPQTAPSGVSARQF